MGAGHCPEAHPTFYLLPFTFHLPEAFGRVRSAPSGGYWMFRVGQPRLGQLVQRGFFDFPCPSTT